MSDANTSLTITPKSGTRAKPDALKQELLDMLRADPDVPNDYHPLIEMAKLANSARLPLNLKMRAHAEIALYTTPKKKPVEHTAGAKSEPPKLELVEVIRDPEEHARITRGLDEEPDGAA